MSKRPTQNLMRGALMVQRFGGHQKASSTTTSTIVRQYYRTAAAAAQGRHRMLGSLGQSRPMLTSSSKTLMPTTTTTTTSPHTRSLSSTATATDNNQNDDESSSSSRQLFPFSSSSFSSSSSSKSLPREYLNPWSSDPTVIEPLQFDVRLDRQSRYELHLLQTMSQIGLTTTIDRVTTHRANSIIQRIMEAKRVEGETMKKRSSSSSSTDGGGGDTTTNTNGNNNNNNNNDNDDNATAELLVSRDAWQKAERARAILEAMEGFDEFRNIDIDHHNNNNINNTNSENSTTTTKNNTETFIKTYVELPHPTNETYWNVLRLYGSVDLQGYLEAAPKRCEEIVKRMEASPLLELKPSALHWNQVLAAWAHSQHRDRPILAAQLLYELHNKSKQRKDTLLIDGSSFSNALRACAMSVAETNDTVAATRFQKLAVSVAVRVWKALVDEHKDPMSTLQLQSYQVVHMLRIFRNSTTTTNDNKRNQQKRDAIIYDVMDAAIEARTINYHVLTALYQVATPTILSHYLGPRYHTSVKRALTLVPKEWLDPAEVQDHDGDGDE